MRVGKICCGVGVERSLGLDRGKMEKIEVKGGGKVGGGKLY
ncbi:hypothetical protein [Staphylococcus epidermidis]|nr:hypothetical protein [Staphylococcus epidermidis]